MVTIPSADYHMPLSHQPLVSVIIPNYNHAPYLHQRIDSILNQKFEDFELILIDDCSVDRSRNILLSYQNNPHVTHIVLNRENSGSPFVQWESGIRLSAGKYIWIAESDDYADEHFLARVIPLLEANPNSQLCLTGSHLVDQHGYALIDDNFDQWSVDGRSYIFERMDYLTTHMLRKNTVYNASMVVFRKEGCLDDISSLYSKMKYAGDWFFWIEQIRKGEVIELHEKLNYFRRHLTNTTAKGLLNGNSYGEIAVIKRYMFSIISDKRIILHEKCRFYREVSSAKVDSADRKRELLACIAQEADATWWRYMEWKLFGWWYKIKK